MSKKDWFLICAKQNSLLWVFLSTGNDYIRENTVNFGEIAYNKNVLLHCVK
jgi:hypothetical protein